jgi:hypothetical protein
MNKENEREEKGNGFVEKFFKDEKNKYGICDMQN